VALEWAGVETEDAERGGRKTCATSLDACTESLRPKLGGDELMCCGDIEISSTGEDICDAGVTKTESSIPFPRIDKGEEL
jgi:hypothetical protein